MNVVLARPDYHTHLITPPLGMAYVCSYLRAAGIDASIVDGLNESLNIEAICARCSEADVVGLFCMSDYFWSIAELSRALKKIGKTVVIGGPQASVMPYETLKHSDADFAVVGEGEQTMLELVRALRDRTATADIAGLVSPDGQHGSDRQAFTDLDRIPFPAWDQIDPRTYAPAPHGAVVKAFPVAPVTSSRGCPFGCHFCASPTIWHRRIRYRSPANVVDEIEMLIKDYGVREIHFEDDNITLKRSHIQGICNELIGRHVKVWWATPNGIRVDTVDRELLLLMKRSGCYSVAFGIESGSQPILDRMEKQTSLDRMRTAIETASSAGLITQAFIIFGLPGETKETIRETMNFVMSVPLHKCQFLLLDLLPGSRLWKDLGPLDMEYFRKRSYQEPGYVPDGLSAEYLKKARSRAFRKFHLRPRQLFTLLRLLKLRQVTYLARRLKDFSIMS